MMSFFNAVPLIAFVIFLFAILWRVIWLKKTGINVFPRDENKNLMKKILFPVFGVLFLIWLFEITKPLFFDSLQVLPVFLTKSLIHSLILQIAGSLVIFLSILLWIVTLFHFKSSFRFGLNENNQGKLITTGIFNVSRNPFFLSINLYFIGISLIMPNLFFIGFAFLAIVTTHFFILKEEKFLQKIYGDDYLNYRKNVGRYL